MTPDVESPQGAGTPKATRRYILYLLRQKKRFLLLVVAAFLAALAGVVELTRATPSYWNFLEPLLAFSTLFVAIGVWVGEGRQEWMDSLPKRLTVCFLHPVSNDEDQRIALLCEDAYLANGGDIRALGQSIGSQMIGGGQLSFLPDIRQSQGQIRQGETTGEHMHYEVVFQLSAKPDPKPRDGFADHFAARAALVWERAASSRQLVWYNNGFLSDARDHIRYALSGRI